MKVRASASGTRQFLPVSYAGRPCSCAAGALAFDVCRQLQIADAVESYILPLVVCFRLIHLRICKDSGLHACVLVRAVVRAHVRARVPVSMHLRNSTPSLACLVTAMNAS
eukprot:6177559-Pleurochrysis_carterae.AAC.3